MSVPNLEKSKELEIKRAEKVAEVRNALEKLSGAQFKKLENLQRMERVLKKEIETLLQAKDKLESHLVTCNYAFYKSIIDEVEPMENALSVLKTFKKNDVSITVDIVTKEPHSWIKLVNRSAKNVLIEYRDGKRNGDIIAQIKQQLYVSRRFNNPQIRVIFKNGILCEMADKLTRHGIIVDGERIEKEHPDLTGKWNDALIEKLGESEDSDWEYDEEDVIPIKPCHQQSRLTSSIPSINLDISAVMLLVSNMCEPSGARFKFQEEMINKHVENERETPAKKPLLEKLKGHRLIMSELALDQVRKIVHYVGGPTEKIRFAELVKTIESIPDETGDVGRVSMLSDIKGITPITKRVFSCAETTGTPTVTANHKFLKHSKAKNIYFEVIEIPPRPLTEQKEANAEAI
ncbi:hypothetical protein GCK72_005933 [Caenorhabditis remanei]|nr:hypothetical protein GCK72_005933 [Caenorhabditis remanei]KAF1765979.1 hypothetical protein GCK72_005933 [Caenorhabditis remanei]